MELVDFYGTSFVVFCLASFEVIGVIWVYGINTFLYIFKILKYEYRFNEECMKCIVGPSKLPESAFF